ncbi:MAG: aspartate--tRNA ligase, partial [Chloroflexi bacterium]|nr:aspartate--tRNA ligase [Chloroflexota bacterium]
LQGWVHRDRDFGGLVFIDLRDRSGVVQCVFNPEEAPEAHAAARQVKSEYVVEIDGSTARRPEGTENPAIPTGAVEVRAAAIRVLNTCKPLPFSLADSDEPNEQIRLQYRYLDLRRPEVNWRLGLRHRVNKAVRDFFDAEGFWEVETPTLIKSTPEGARDFLVPSRMTPGQFYALPQSPQLLKQLLMVSGVERYFQIARCFRDEDLRADRQPEFTQIDVEMSFVDQDDVLTLIERMTAHVFRNCMGIEVPLPLPRYSYKHVMETYGSDRPDMRFGLRFQDLTDLAAQSSFRVFSGTAASGGVVKGMAVPGGGSYSRKQVDDLEAFAKSCGASGLVWIQRTAEGVKSPAAKFLSGDEMEAIFRRIGVDEGDLALIVAGTWHTACSVLGRIRERLGAELSLVADGRYDFYWVVDFPSFEYDADEGRFTFTHNPVCAPQDADLPLLDEGLRAIENASIPPDSPEHPLNRMLSKQHDLVLNGNEIAGGSIRIHDTETQLKVLRAMGFTVEEAWKRFGFLLSALEYGAPPHGGIAFGLDRVIAIMAGCDSIRDVIAFPKNNSGVDLMMETPSPVDDKQLRELGIKLVERQRPQ